jgi:menaquinol-cytochrome c reductase iron-sulfur subunit
MASEPATPNGHHDGHAMKPPGWYEGETITRRRMFTGGALALGGIATVAIGLPAIGFALGPVFHESKVTWQDVGPPSDFTFDNYVPKTITLSSNIGQVGSRSPGREARRVRRDIDALRTRRLSG